MQTCLGLTPPPQADPRLPQGYNFTYNMAWFIFLQQDITLLTSGHVLSPSSALSVVSVLPLLDLSVPRQLGGSSTNIIIHQNVCDFAVFL
ncbi:hypothetical protein SAMD00079811_72380 [Scytonema sp. HK-05]|nr:hypothetical protein SAMD00079811_72380 [Scytonema sp. HK-05]